MQAKRVLVFGGSGFLGSHIVSQLLRQNYSVVVITRDAQKANFLKTMGPIGKLVIIQCDVNKIGDENSLAFSRVARYIRWSEVVINSIGMLHALGGKDKVKKGLNLVQHTVPARIAEMIQSANKKDEVKRKFIHVSALLTNKVTPSLVANPSELAKLPTYIQTKFLGEEAVLKSLPSATIIRPSLIFGKGENLIKKMVGISSNFSIAPLITNSQMLNGAALAPVHVMDIASGIVNRVINDESLQGMKIDFTGPDIISWHEVIRAIQGKMIKNSDKKLRIFRVRYNFALYFSKLFFFIPPISEQMKQMILLAVQNNVSSKNIERKVVNYHQHYKDTNMRSIFSYILDSVKEA